MIAAAHSDAIVEAALRQGDTRVLMYRHQIRASRILDAMGPFEWAFLLWSRRAGKTEVCALNVHRDALRPLSIIRYAAPSKYHARTFILPAFARIAERLPEHLRPKYNAMDSLFEWPNGSRCIIGSCETRRDVEVQKGTSCHRAYIEEAGIIDPSLLEYLIADVLNPQFLTTGGNGAIVGTPPKLDLPEHPFWEHFEKCAAAGRAMRLTIDEVTHIPDEMKSAAIEAGGGMKSNSVRREYYVERVDDKEFKIVPEWDAVGDECTAEVEPAEWRDWYVAGDFGFHDLTGVLFAWYDFERARIIVEDEIAMQGASGLDIGYEVARKEAQLGIVPKARVADAPEQMLADLSHMTLGPGVSFGPAMKDDAEASLNSLRMEIAKKRIIVNPRCKTLLRHLKFGCWNERRSSFERIDGFGHWDMIDALKYLNRAIPRKRNPAPVLLPGQLPHTHAIPSQLMKQRRRTTFIHGRQRA